MGPNDRESRTRRTSLVNRCADSPRLPAIPAMRTAAESRALEDVGAQARCRCQLVTRRSSLLEPATLGNRRVGSDFDRVVLVELALHETATLHVEEAVRAHGAAMEQHVDGAVRVRPDAFVVVCHQ